METLWGNQVIDVRHNVVEKVEMARAKLTFYLHLILNLKRRVIVLKWRGMPSLDQQADSDTSVAGLTLPQT